MGIKKLFIANRAEIACRIARTARRMGIRTCGVYTPQDTRVKHVRELDELTQLPYGDLRKNYLNQELLIEVAQKQKANAIHPGYGFLSENPDFAEKVQKAGLIWVGPNPAAMRMLGGKIEAKEVAARVGVPVPPWMRLGEDSKIDNSIVNLGLPLLIKAAHGGGGRGQRVVRETSQFAEAIRAARSEALRSFGSGELFVERFLDRPRHIEVQIFADHHGNVYALGERDCTLQRRNQKIIEESPAVVLDAETRNKTHQAAIALAKEAKYTNAGTIEFLAQRNTKGDWEYFFMELNARLQVEHPVTEMQTGLDLVELQLRIAQNEKIELNVKPQGHSIELRLCAEDPVNNFLPTPGPITDWSTPEVNGLRIDEGYDVGDVIPQEYDSLFAKMIFHAKSREEAIEQLSKVLNQTLIAGVITNKFYLQSLLASPDFKNNSTYTRWIEEHPAKDESERLNQYLKSLAGKWSSELFVQRSQTALPPELLISDAGEFKPDESIHGTSSPQGLVRVGGWFGDDYASGWINRYELCITFERALEGIGQRRMEFAGEFEVKDVKAHHGPIVAQVPGVVLDVRARVNEIVEARTPILIVEAMKIEMPMILPIAAKITAIHVRRGDRIQPGQTLVVWEPAA